MKVYQYIRISDKDQSNCSIDGQQRFNQMFAEKNGMEIIETFIDDGVSAKDFNRPEWKKLEAKLKTRSIKGVVVWKYDRLIRNVMEGLAFLDRSEKQYGCTIYSAMETFSINPFDPMFFKIRADILVNAEYERRIITDRTNFGIWSAKMQGKYIGQAPFGYVNARDERNKPIIIVDDTKRPIIEYIFQCFSIGQSPKRIQTVANQLGMNRAGHDTIRNIVTNPVYKGFILAPDYKGHGVKLVKGIHESTIDIETWEKCQLQLHEDKPKSVVNSDLPLRGLARCCTCGDIMTGGRSKGRSSYYHYYRCFNCTNVNLNTNTVESRIIGILNSISIHDRIIKKVENDLLKSLSSMKSESDKERKSISHRISDIKAKKENLEDKYISNKLDHETFEKWKLKFNQEISLLDADLKYITTKSNLTGDVVEKNIKRLAKLGGMYEISSVEEKQELCRYIFQNHLYLSNTSYRTAFFSELFSYNVNTINGLDMFTLDELGKIYYKSPECTRFRIVVEPPTIEGLILILNKIA